MKFIKILVSKILYIIVIPVVFGGITFLFTRNLPVKFAAEATIYTGITSNSGLEVLETRVDNIATQNEYNNVLTLLKSKSLYEEVGLKLLTQHLLLSKPQEGIISERAFNQLQEQVPDKIKKLIVKGNFDKSYQNLRAYIKQDKDNYIYGLLNYSSPYYSEDALSNIKCVRVSNSDLIKLTYESDDAAISFNTIKIITESFVTSYSVLKSNQSSSAVAYFEAKLKEIEAKLKAAEDGLLAFNVDNTIINYYEQTEQVTTQQEKIEIRLQEVKMEYEASQAVLQKLESEINKRYNISLRNKEILSLRQKLVDNNNAIAKNEINNVPSKEAENKQLKLSKSKLETKLATSVDSLYNYNNNSEGIEFQRILSEWLDAVKNYETYSALYKSMMERQTEFMKQYKKYAPLGATIKRIEREIDVYEREYLNVLNNLNLAKQKQQNTDMVSTMKIIDQPELPINGIPSKKKLYVIIAALFSVLFYIIGLFIVELLDQRIKTPSKLKTLTGLEILGAFSVKSSKKVKSAEWISERASKFIYEKIRSLQTADSNPFVIQITSNWESSENILLAETIQNELLKYGNNVNVFNLNDNQNEDVISQFNKSNQYSEFVGLINSEPNFLITILPPVSNGINNSIIIQSADLNLIVFDADATWTEADNFNLDKIKRLLSNNLYSILVNALPDNIEEIYGEIDKNRSFIRKFFKKILRRFI
ncbi:MAG: hypothetical protein PHS59_14080 [Paludibacter sp.]|nr:hypothetical protein [Paludibacter sp.]